MTDTPTKDAEAEAPLVLTDPLPPPASVEVHSGIGRRFRDRARARRHARALRRKRGGFWLMPSLIFLALGVTFAALALSGKPIHLPVWAVAEVESRLNRALDEALGADVAGAGVSLGGLVVTVDADWVPRLRLEDVRLLQPGGGSLLTLPEVRIAMDPGSLSQGQLRLRSLRIIGPSFAIRRLKDGRFDLSFGQGRPPISIDGMAGLIDAAIGLFGKPALSNLRLIEAEGLSLSLDDRLTGRVWDLGDGRFRLDNREAELAMELGATLVGGGKSAAQMGMQLFATKATSEARLSFSVDQIAAADIAAQAAPLAVLGVLDAPISGQFFTALDSNGVISGIEAVLSIGAGALRPTATTEPVNFDSADLRFNFVTASERVDLQELTVESNSLRLAASGHAYLPGVATGLPDAVLAQVQFSKVMVDPEGLFVEPVGFDTGALDLRVRLNPFRVDIGQLALIGNGSRLSASGKVVADPEGWRVGLDVALDQIAHDRLLALWPVSAVPRTRAWIADNVQQGQLFDVKAALRLAPGAEPRLSLGYDYTGADVRFLKTLPPIRNGAGYAVAEGKSYTLVLDRGFVTPEEGGQIDVAGSVFAVPDITQKPAQAEITLRTAGSLTATLSLLDQPPFSFLTKAKQPVDLGEGFARASGRIVMPLRKGVQINDVDWAVSGVISDFRSDKLVPGRTLQAATLEVQASPKGLEIGGKGTLQGVEFDARYTKLFGPDHVGKSRIEGTAELSSKSAERLNVTLPQGLLQGTGRAAVTVDLQAGQPPRLQLRSTLAGVGMSIPQIGWSKPKGGTGALDVSVNLTNPAQVSNVSLRAAGLTAQGRISLRADGGLDVARFSRVQYGGWLDAAVELAGRGKGRAPSVSLTGGNLDLRGLPRGSSGASTAASGAISVALDRLTVTKGIALTGFRANLTASGGGLNGDFNARVNGNSPISGSLVPTARGSAIRIRANDAGGILSSAGIFPNARGGGMEVIMTPNGGAGGYSGTLQINNIRIQRVPVLAELLNTISVVGILDQLNGSGLLFSQAQAEFRLTPRGIEVTRGSAAGASLGVSTEGLYLNEGNRLNFQGVISPIYLLNGIGSLLTRRGEGLFGFNYTVGGTTQAPAVSVNPLSIFTPGMFREIFRADPATLGPGG